jgi:zinc protease
MSHRDVTQAEAELAALTLDDLRAWHRDAYGSSEGQIAIVGDFDPAQIKPLLQSLFASWATPAPYAPISTHYFAVAAHKQTIETPDKPNAMFSARQNLPLRDEDPDYAALRVADDIFGGSGLKSRLGDRVRQKEGLSYSIGSDISADASVDNRDDAGSFSIQAIAAPQNMPKLEAAVREELARFVQNGVTEAELKDTVHSLLVARQQARASDGNVAGMLNSDAFLGRTLQQRTDYETKLQSLTVAQVNAAIRKFLKPELLSVYTAGDFANAAKSPAPAAVPAAALPGK